MAKVFMKGNEAVAEAAIRAGCRFFAGYPITPQSQVTEYMSWRMPEAGGQFVQSESEIAAICMIYGAAACGFRAFGSSSGPGFSLKQEGISYIASAELPVVIMDVQRWGSGLGDIFQAQSDYFQAVKGGGHGDYRAIVYAPSTLQESVDLIGLSFDKAEQYKNPVIFLTDGSLGQVMEPVEFPEMYEHNPNQPWALQGKQGGDFRRVTSTMYYIEDYTSYLQNKYAEIIANEQRAENIQTEDAELIFVAYGISSRICQEAVTIGRSQGIKLGLIRPITLWPFPKQYFQNLSKNLKAFLTVELSCLGGIYEDVALASGSSCPIYASLTGDHIPFAGELVQRAQNILNGNDKPII